MITMRFKIDFFNTAKVIRAMDRATRKALSRAGAFIRTTARRSIRTRKSTSKPGNPPHSHSGELRRRIYFSADLAAQNVVIGPVRFGKGEAPRLLEFGGTSFRQAAIPMDVCAAEIRSDWGDRPVLRHTYRPRPFMGPALEAEAPKMPDLWRGAIAVTN